MRVLLDTRCWLWLQTTPERIPDELLDTLADRSEELFLSAASAWELGIKHAAGRIELPEAPEVYVGRGMRQAGVRELPVSHAHALAAAALPPHHRDPFDRLLVAQTRLEDLTLVTADRALAACDVDLIRIGRASCAPSLSTGFGPNRIPAPRRAGSFRGGNGE